MYLLLGQPGSIQMMNLQVCLNSPTEPLLDLDPHFHMRCLQIWLKWQSDTQVMTISNPSEANFQK